MPASPTTRNRFKKPEVGAELNTWGDALNTSVIALVDDAIDGWTTINTGGATTLSSTNYVADQSRMRLINYTAVTAGVITIPAVQKWYLVRAPSAAVEITNGGTSVTVRAGDTSLVATDGSVVYKIQTNDFNSRNLTNVLDPTSDQHAATKKYVDDAILAAALNGTLPGLIGNALKVLRVKADETGPEWSTKLPAQSSGTAGYYLKSTGTEDAEAWDQPIRTASRKTANYTAVAGDRLECDTTGGAFTVTLPATPAAGDRVIIWDGGNSSTTAGFAGNTLTVARNGSTIAGEASDMTITTKGLAITFEYVNGTWSPQRG
jgi:hypothetical protein